MAENIDVNVNVNTSQAQRNLANFNKQVESLGNSFSGLKRILTGALLANFITGAFRSASAVKDLSEQTGIAVQSLLGLRQAFAENASSAAAADDAMLKLTKNISEARNGNDELAKSFEELGVNVFQGNINDQALQVIDGLGKIKNQADQTRLAMETMGKGSAANYAGIAASVRPAIAANAEAAIAVIKAEEAAQKFDSAIAELQKQLLIALVPLSDFVKEINFSSKALKDFIEVGMALAVVIGTFTLLGRVGKGISAIFGTIKNAGQSLATTFKVLKHYWDRFVGAIEVPKPKNTLFEGITKSIGYLLSALAALGGALGTIAAFIIPESVLSAFKTLGQAIGLINDDTEKLKQMNEESARAHSEATKKALEEQALLAAKTKEQIANIREVGQAYKDANKDVLTSLDNQLKYLQMSERDAEVAATIDDIRKNSTETIKKLQAELAKLPQGEMARRNAILETIAVIKKDTDLTVNGVTAKLSAIQKEREAIDARNRAIEFGEQIRQDTEALQRMQDEINMIGMTTEQREILRQQLENERTLKERLAAIDKEAAMAGKNATESQIADWERRRQAAITYYSEVGKLQQTERDKQKALEQDYTKGVEKGLESIAEQFKPINMAQEAVQKGWGAISDAVDTFVQTGKFKFSDFARSVLADLAKMIIKAQIFKAISGIAGAFGISLPGLATGGPAKAGQPYIVGEKGPELFVPQGSGTVVPNNKLGAQGMATGAVNAPVTNNYITNNISAIDAKGVAQLFAENRKTLLGSVKMAEREMPYMAR